MLYTDVWLNRCIIYIYMHIIDNLTVCQLQFHSSKFLSSDFIIILNSIFVWYIFLNHKNKASLNLILYLSKSTFFNLCDLQSYIYRLGSVYRAQFKCPPKFVVFMFASMQYQHFLFLFCIRTFLKYYLVSLFCSWVFDFLLA